MLQLLILPESGYYFPESPGVGLPGDLATLIRCMRCAFIRQRHVRYLVTLFLLALFNLVAQVCVALAGSR